VILLYAITEAPAPEVEEDGVRAVEHDGLAAVIQEVEEAPKATPEAVLAHERVVESVMRVRALLPARFGMTLGTEDELRRVLTDRGPSLREALSVVRGCVELSVRVHSEGDGADEAEGAVHAALSGSARADASFPLADGGRSAAYLVPAEDVRAFAQRLVALQDEHPALDISCTGPWPPYSFTDGRA
jgi:hypothetical protein